MEEELKKFLEDLFNKIKSNIKTYQNINIQEMVNLTWNINELLVSDITEEQNWSKTIYPTQLPKNQGLILVKDGQDYVIIMSGGNKKRPLINKIRQEFSQNSSDTGKTLYRYMHHSINVEKSDYLETVKNYSWVIISTDVAIEKEVLGALCIGISFLLDPRYPLKTSYPELLDKIRNKSF